MHDVRIALDEHQLLDLHGAVFADAAYVVAAQIDQHDVLGDFFFVRAQLGFNGAILLFIFSARTGSGDGAILHLAAMHAYQQFGG
jgi:hypothetical protein